MKNLISALSLCLLGTLSSQVFANDVYERCYDYLDKKVSTYNPIVGLFRITLDPDYDEDLAAINCQGIETEEKLARLMQCHDRMESGKASVIASFCSGPVLRRDERMIFATDCYNDKERHAIKDQFSRATACSSARDEEEFAEYKKCVDTALSRNRHGYSQKRWWDDRCAGGGAERVND